MCEWIATMLMPASRNDFRAGRRSFSVTTKSPSTTAFSSLPAKATQVLTPIVLSIAIGGNCADVRQGRLEQGIGGRRVGGAKLSDLVVKKADRGGEMLERAFTFDVHEEQSRVIKKEMVVQSGNTQAAFQGHEHRKINFIL